MKNETNQTAERRIKDINKNITELRSLIEESEKQITPLSQKRIFIVPGTTRIENEELIEHRRQMLKKARSELTILKQKPRQAQHDIQRKQDLEEHIHWLSSFIGAYEGSSNIRVHPDVSQELKCRGLEEKVKQWEADIINNQNELNAMQGRSTE